MIFAENGRRFVKISDDLNFRFLGGLSTSAKNTPSKLRVRLSKLK
jgi:hypothetical protein